MLLSVQTFESEKHPLSNTIKKIVGIAMLKPLKIPPPWRNHKSDIQWLWNSYDESIKHYLQFIVHRRFVTKTKYNINIK